MRVPRRTRSLVQRRLDDMLARETEAFLLRVATVEATGPLTALVYEVRGGPESYGAIGPLVAEAPMAVDAEYRHLTASFPALRASTVTGVAVDAEGRLVAGPTGFHCISEGDTFTVTVDVHTDY